MHTTLCFRDDAYLQSTEATVVAIDEAGCIVLDRTIFYPEGGGQPGDQGELTSADGQRIAIVDTQWRDKDKQQVLHIPDKSCAHTLQIGSSVTLALDWALRHQYMRMHTALHLLSVLLPYPVTGGSISAGTGRLDFDLPEMPYDKAGLSAALQEIVAKDAPVQARWISEAELDANPALVKTLSVQPPRGAGQVRLIEIQDLDLQPCGGTHLSRTSEVGEVWVKKIEKKGQMNRRVRLQLGAPA